MASLPPQLDAYRQAFLDQKETAQTLIDGADEAALVRRPDEDRWSVAECFDHVNTAGWLLLSKMENAIEPAKIEGPFGAPPFRYGFFSRQFIKSMEPDSRWTFTAPSVYEPDAPQTLHPKEAVREFMALQDDLARCVERADGLDLRKIRLASPAVPLLRISLGAWFEATAAHQRRHLVQAQDALDAATRVEA